ncbi:hypothetical protein [Lacticaseibacillus absianus]|uniref:hypothetical protein n=1 Tax=Lacticaseibacillus absianus TaxID=2729623 RepID=UPI0015CD39E4|nr:hypothetical protein [Lacticaseibacillus absianus]
MRVPWRRLRLVALVLTLGSVLMPPMQGIADGTTGGVYLYQFGWPISWLEARLSYGLPGAAGLGGLVTVVRYAPSWQVNLVGLVGTWLVALALAVLGWRLWHVWHRK